MIASINVSGKHGFSQ